MRTREEIEVDIVQVEAQAATARHNASDWQKTAKACEDSLSRLRAELAALPPAPVRLRAVDAGEFLDIRGDSEAIYIATVHKDTCARHNISAQALAAHIRAFSQPDPNAEALAAADALAEAFPGDKFWNYELGYSFAGRSIKECWSVEYERATNALAAYRKAREVQQ